MKEMCIKLKQGVKGIFNILTKAKVAITKRINIVFAVMFWISSFLYDEIIFKGKISEHILVYILIKCLFGVVCYFVSDFFCKALVDAGSNEHRVLLYAMPVVVIYLVFFLSKHSMYLVGDEEVIFNSVADFDLYPAHFTYITGIFYIMSLMFIPYPVGIVIVKILLQALICGYCVMRLKSKFAYIVFILFPVIVNSILIHRMQIYGLLYLFVFAKCIFDNKEKINMQISDFLLLSFCLAILSVWRKEGIYLLVTAPFILYFTYYKSNKLKWKKYFLGMYLIMLIIWSPELGNYFHDGGFVAEQSHSYNFYFVNMCRLGLDRNKYREQFESVDKVISIEAVDRINKDFGNDNYADEWIAFKPGYIGIKENYSDAEAIECIKAIQYMIINEPLLFLKAQFGAWNYSSFGNGRLQHASMIHNLLNTIWYNLYIPLFATIVFFFISFCHRNLIGEVLILGVLLHVFVTMILAPAGYFKYYYHMYLIGWFIVMIGVQNLYVKYLEHF